jgi:hypothetical protein
MMTASTRLAEEQAWPPRGSRWIMKRITIAQLALLAIATTFLVTSSERRPQAIGRTAILGCGRG